MGKCKKGKLFGNINFDADKKNNIETVVLNCFIRVLKDNGSYMFYRRCVDNTGIMKALLKSSNRRSADNPFSSASSTTQVVDTLRRITNDMAKSNGKRGGVNDLDKYEIVTMAINHLLHFFMETNGVSMQRLCELGEEIYSMSCFKLFGDTEDDLEKQSENELSSMTNSEQIRAKLFQEFVKDLQQGRISSSMNFDDYASMRLRNGDNISISTSNMDEHMGHALGRVPDDRWHAADNTWEDFDDDDDRHF